MANVGPFRQTALRKAGLNDFWANGKSLGTYEEVTGKSYLYAPWAGPSGVQLFSVVKDSDPTTSLPPGPDFINARNNHTPYSFHQGGVVVGFCDGSVHFIAEDISFETYWNLIVPNDGRVLGDF